jgi:hypothetical protein
MKVMLVPQSEHEKMVSNIKIEPKKLYDMALDIIQPLWQASPSLLDSLRFVYKPANPASGEFEFFQDGLDIEESTTRITINLARIRTYRDLVYTLYHEWRHAGQFLQFGKARFFHYVKAAEIQEYYTDCLIERDADAFAFKREDRLTYKNFVINKNVPYSIFLTRKKAQSF